MGRNRKPKALAELDGTFEKHPERRANYESEPKPQGSLGEPPESFKPEEYKGSRLLAIWNEIVSQAPPGVLTSSDRLHVEMTCRAIYKIRFSEPKASDYNTVREFLGKMAMNPADRPKLQVMPAAGSQPTAKPDANRQENPFAQLVEEGRAGTGGPDRPN